MQVTACTADRLAPSVEPSSSKADSLRPAHVPSTSHQEAPKDSLVAMDQDGYDNDDLLQENMVDYEALPERAGMEVNVITFSVDHTIIGDDESIVAQFDFGSKEMIFTKSIESVNHLKSLYVRGHIDETPISRMLIDGGAAINLMPYSLNRKLGKQDNELIRTNMTLSGVGSNNPFKAKDVTSVELTIRTKNLVVAFFITKLKEIIVLS
jgi:hypothetical protein